MNCRVEELCNKDVINIMTGNKIGYVCDVEVDTCSGQVCNLLIMRNERLLSLKKPDYIKVPWHDIEVLGNETILIRNCCDNTNNCDQRRFFNIFKKTT